MQHSPRFLHLIEQVRHKVKHIDADALYDILNHPIENFYLIDVREKEEYLPKHLPGAIHLSKGVLERDIEKTIADPNAAIVVYCSGGYRSQLAAYNLELMGYKNVKSLNGGSSHWFAKNLPGE